MASAKAWQRNLTFGGRLPWAVGLLGTITLVLSLLSAFGDRHAGGLFELVALVPGLVLRGQIWRLATWLFVEPSPIGLIFTCLSLYWFAAPLAQSWGSRRFLVFFATVMAAAASVTCLIALFDPTVAASMYLGGYAMGAALLVAWGLTFPNQVVRFYFLIPITGFWIAWLTVAITAIYAVYTGWAAHLPELLGELSVLAWIFRRRLAVRLTLARAGVDASVRRAARRSERGVVIDLTGNRVDPDDRKPN
jgi:membrane associated rhomboid family serine protease